MKKSILFFLLIGLIILNSCEIQEPILTEQNNSNPIYNSVISSYLTNLKTSVSNNKEKTKKISTLIQAIDYNTIKQYGLKNTIKLVVVDLKNFSVFSKVDHTKAIFFVLNNNIIQSNIVTIKNKLPFENPDQIIVSIFDKKENKDNYSGKIEFYNLFQNILLSDEFENGKLTVNGIALPNVNNSTIKRSSDCTDWFWITTYSNGNQTEQYLFTTCDPCSGGGGELFRYADCQSGGNSNSNSGPSYPTNPKNNELFTYLNEDGELITERYDAKEKIWKFYKIQLNQVIVVNNYKNRYDFLNRPDTNKNKPIIFEDIIYKFDWPSGSWEGESATDVAIAQAIEDQIDDSKLDPCLKAIMNQLKNTTNIDITKILTKLGANSIYTVDMVMKPANTYAETQKIAKYNYEIRVDRDRNTDATTLFKATALIHEVIHAYFLSIIDDYNYTPSNTIASFPELFEAYVKKNYPNPSDAQHKEMAERYVEAMASALQEYDANFTVPYQVYQDLAWGSLSKAPIFNKTFPPGSTDNIRITNRYKAEGVGRAVDQGTPNQQTPVGKPCK